MKTVSPALEGIGRAPVHSPIHLGEGAKLRRGRIHEVTGRAGDMFALMAAARCESDVIWIGLRRDVDTLCPSGLRPYIDPARLILIEAVSRGELLWAMEQALRAEGAFTVVMEMPDCLHLRESRRLQLAAEQGGGLGLVLLQGAPASSAAQTRWRCEPACGRCPSWDWICLKGKNGEIGAWQASCAGGVDAKDTLYLAATAAA